MTSPEQIKYLARTLFQNKILLASGNGYERLFGQVMQYSRSGFQKIRPYGNQGDRGNDGYEKEHGRYFQLYAPEDPEKHHNIQRAIHKAKSDFVKKLIPHWSKFCPVKEYYFAFNDKYSGSTYEIEHVLSELKSTHNLNDACLYQAKHLEDEYINLNEDQISMIVGGIPNIDSSMPIEFSFLNEIIGYILGLPPIYSRKSDLNVPDVYEKIKFNGLNRFGHYIRAKQYEIYQIDEYFSRNSNFMKQKIREHLAGYYDESLSEFPEKFSEKLNNLGDNRFAFILDKISPMTNNPAIDRLRREAALVLMAKYFESCDIFEEPQHATT